MVFLHGCPKERIKHLEAEIEDMRCKKAGEGLICVCACSVMHPFFTILIIGGVTPPYSATDKA
jgi:hypothetical protein